MTANTDTGQWLPIESAPRDGTPILAWCIHPHARYATDDKDWAAAVVTQWTTFNGGGWTWHGALGTFTHWRHLPNPPASGAALEAASEPLSDALAEHPSPSPDLTDDQAEAMVVAYAASFRLLRSSIHKDIGAAIRAAYLASPGPSLQAALREIAEPMKGSWEEIAFKRREIAKAALNPTLTNEEKGSG